MFHISYGIVLRETFLQQNRNNVFFSEDNVPYKKRKRVSIYKHVLCCCRTVVSLSFNISQKAFPLNKTMNKGKMF